MLKLFIPCLSYHRYLSAYSIILCSLNSSRGLRLLFCSMLAFGCVAPDDFWTIQNGFARLFTEEEKLYWRVFILDWLEILLGCFRECTYLQIFFIISSARMLDKCIVYAMLELILAWQKYFSNAIMNMIVCHMRNLKKFISLYGRRECLAFHSKCLFFLTWFLAIFPLTPFFGTVT